MVWINYKLLLNIVIYLFLLVQVAQKEEMGESLSAIDFDKLKIENQQYQERIAAKNKELMELKVATGEAVQVR